MRACRLSVSLVGCFAVAGCWYATPGASRAPASVEAAGGEIDCRRSGIPTGGEISLDRRERRGCAGASELRLLAAPAACLQWPPP